MASKDTLGLVAAATAVAATIATFAKSFVPFYLVGSTAIFVFACFVAIVLIAMRWREILDNASYATNILVLLAIFYGIVVVNFIYNYDFQFFFGLAAGVIALKRWELAKAGAGQTPPDASPPPKLENSPA